MEGTRFVIVEDLRSTMGSGLQSLECHWWVVDGEFDAYWAFFARVVEFVDLMGEDTKLGVVEEILIARSTRPYRRLVLFPCRYGIIDKSFL